MNETPVKFVIRVYFETISEFIENYGPHISEGGMTLMLTRELKPQDLVGIEFKLKSEYPLIQGKARVMEVHPEGNAYRVRVQFLDLDEKSQQVIQQAIKMKGARPLSASPAPQEKGEEKEKEEVSEVSEDLLEVPEVEAEAEVEEKEETLSLLEETGEESPVVEEEEPSPSRRELLTHAFEDSLSEKRQRSLRRIAAYTGITLLLLALLGGGLWFLLQRRPQTVALEKPHTPPLPAPVTQPAPFTHPEGAREGLGQQPGVTGGTAAPAPLTAHAPPPPAPPSPSRDEPKKTASLKEKPQPARKVMAPAKTIKGFEVEGERVGIILDGEVHPPQVKGFTMKNPDRYVVDLKGVELKRGIRAPRTGGIIAGIRHGNHPGYARVVLDLKASRKFRVEIEGDRVWIVPSP